MNIIQLLPADHWYAEYSNPKGIDHYSKVVCFGLIECLDIKCNNFEGYIYSPNKNLESED